MAYINDLGRGDCEGKIRDLTQRVDSLETYGNNALAVIAEGAVAGPIGPTGPIGTPGGNVMSVGAKMVLEGASTPSGTSLVQADSYDGTLRSAGPIPFVKNRGTTDEIIAKYPRFTFKSASLEAWEMPLKGPSVTEIGIYPDGSDTIAATREAVDWCCERGINELYWPNVGTSTGFYWSDTLAIDNAITLRSCSTGRSGNNRSKSVIRVANGKTGIVVHTAATSPRAGQTGGDGSRILGLKLVGGQNDFAATTSCIQLRARAEIDQVVGEYFGHGVQMRVASGSGATEGNVNLSYVHNSSFAAGRGHAIDIGLGDANCISVTESEGIGFNGFGINGANFLSCYFHNFHTVQNGTFAGRRGGSFAAVNYAIGGQFYFFVADYRATPAQLLANAPTLANNTYWWMVYKGANPSYPIWGTGDTNYAPGGPFMIAGPGKAIALYSESDQPPAQVHGFGWLDAGTHAAGVVGNGVYTNVRFGMMDSARGYVVNDDPSGRAVTLAENGSARGNILGWADTSSFPAGAKLAQGNDLAEFRHGNTDGDIYRWLRMYGPNHPTAPMHTQLLKVLFSGPAYADNAAATTAGIPVGALYRRTDGTIAARI